MLKHYVAWQVWMATRKPSKGQSLAEYGLILALIAVFCIGALTLMGEKIRDMLSQLANTIDGVDTNRGAAGN